MKEFSLKSSDRAFDARKKAVFDQLGVLESTRQISSTPDNDSVSNDRKGQRKETKHFRGKESIFKHPTNPVPKNFLRKLPDFKKNPHKWTKYSLEDVQEVTEESNRKSALDFLKQLAERNQQRMNVDDDNDGGKIVFNKHVKKPDGAATSTASYNNSKLIMPEYVIGQKTKSKKTQKTANNKQSKELKLDHLIDDNDE